VDIEFEKVVELVGEGGDSAVDGGLGEEGEAEGGGVAGFTGAGEGWGGERDILEMTVGVGDVFASVSVGGGGREGRLVLELRRREEGGGDEHGSVEACDVDEIARVVEVFGRGSCGCGCDSEEGEEEQDALCAEGYAHPCGCRGVCSRRVLSPCALAVCSRLYFV